MGGFTSGRKEIIDMLRQKSKTIFIFKLIKSFNCWCISKVIDLLSESTHLRDKLEDNTQYFRKQMILLDLMFQMEFIQLLLLCYMMPKLNQLMSNKLLDEGIFVVGFFYPVVPKDKKLADKSSDII